MTRFLRALTLCLALTPVVAHAEDEAGSADHPLIGRYEGSEIDRYQTADFDEARLRNAIWNGDADTKDGFLSLEGKTTRIVYSTPEGRSSLEVFKNVTDAMAANGFAPIFTCKDDECTPDESDRYRFADLLSDGNSTVYNACSDHARYQLAKVTKHGTDVYAGILACEGVTQVDVVEVTAMETDKVVFLKSSDMADALALQGRVALYGIYFDTDSDQPKAESNETLAEIAKLLEEKPDLQLIVAGHTDSEGAFDYNVDLSTRRAKAVVAALTKDFGIAADRLTPFGDGMTAPVASNADEAGRAKNRRVELVQR